MVGIFDESGVLVKTTTFPTPNNQNEYLAVTAKVVRKMLGVDKIEKISLALPAIMKEPEYYGFEGLHAAKKHSELMFANLQWTDFNPAEELYSIFEVPLVAANDGDLAALYESRIREFSGTLLALPLGWTVGISHQPKTGRCSS